MWPASLSSFKPPVRQTDRHRTGPCQDCRCWWEVEDNATRLQMQTSGPLEPPQGYLSGWRPCCLVPALPEAVWVVPSLNYHQFWYHRVQAQLNLQKVVMVFALNMYFLLLHTIGTANQVCLKFLLEIEESMHYLETKRTQKAYCKPTCNDIKEWV